MSQKGLRIALLILLIVGMSNAVFSQARTEVSPKFLILIETTSDGIKLTSEVGCAWKELTFTIDPDKPQGIDENGMAFFYNDKVTNNISTSAFYFIIKKTKEGISLEGRKGTSWTKLSFSCENGKCNQYIDTNGMITKS